LGDAGLGEAAGRQESKFPRFHVIANRQLDRNVIKSLLRRCGSGKKYNRCCGS
jgi:hypothetical protein